MTARDVLITGLGLVSSLGEGADRHWNVFSGSDARPVLDAGRFAPYVIHPLPEIDWNLQIARRGDQRQMETWQRLGVYTAGLALDDADAKHEALLSAMDMIVAAGGGERDVAVDQSILDAGLTRDDRELLLNERLTTELRPTLFLAQLSNLLAGNISIVHKVTGSSRTFMGEEGSGVSAIETAVARIRSGQSSQVLVGGAFQTEHPDMLLSYELGGFLHRGPWAPVRQRAASEGGGVITGSGAAFLVLESREHAEARGRKAYAAVAAIESGRGMSKAGDGPQLLDDVIGRAGDRAGPGLVISGTSGARDALAREQAELDRHPDAAVRAFGSLTGHLKEAQFPFAVALAALSVFHDGAFAPIDPETERPYQGKPGWTVASTIGHASGEGAAVIVPA